MTDKEPLKIFEQFIEPDKCQYIIDTYKDHCKRSTVVDTAGKDIVDSARTSSTYFLPDEDPVVQEIKAKTSAMCGLPIDHIEGLQLVRYAHGEQYKYHYDYFDAIKHNQRKHTFLLYLNELKLEDGGATSFKILKAKVYPSTGRCVWFRNMNEDGTLNDRSLHAGDPIESKDVVKYAVNIWVREKPLADAIKGPETVAGSQHPFLSLLFAVLATILFLTVVVVGIYWYRGERLPIQGFLKMFR
jgi:prolyl 4-hydroxylase